MNIRSLCKTNIVTITKNSTLKDVAILMAKSHVGCVVVTETFNGKRIPAGIITDRDIALTVGFTPMPQELAVDQIMQPHPVTIQYDESLMEAILRMREMGVKRLPVVDLEGSLYGIISSDDLLSFMGEEIQNISKITQIQIENEQGVSHPKETHILM